MPLEVDQARWKGLHEVAQGELRMSCVCVLANIMSQSYNYDALRQWADQDLAQYDEYIQSSELSVLRIAATSVWLRRKGIQWRDSDFSFTSLDGYNPFPMEKFETANKAHFIESVRSHKCISRTDHNCLTLLQIAALRGDLQLARTLVVDLGANVDDAGATPGLTPLWFSCLSGNIGVAVFLVEKGANPRCRDGFSGRTILHFLNQCRTADAVKFIIEQALQAGLNLEDRDSAGNTPLLSTFVGWDFSLGVAAHLLLNLKVNVLVKAKTKWSPLSAAVQRLDFNFVQEICNNFRHSQLRATTHWQLPDQSIEDEKADAFGTMITHNEFYRRRIGGAATQATLEGIIDLLVDDNMIAASRSSEIGSGTNPLIASCYLGYDDLAAAVLNTKFCPDLDEVDDMNGMSALHWAAQRNRYNTFVRIFERGANPLILDKEGLNAFHQAARFSPDLLLRIVEGIEAGRIHKPDGPDVRAILNIPTTKDSTAFALAVIEGTWEHLRVAEILRNRYHLSYDEYIFSTIGEPRMTLLAYMIRVAVMTNLIELEQIEYLLNLEPRPKFKAGSAGETLFHYAVRGWQHGKL